MTFEAEFIDAEYIDGEYAKYTNAASGPVGKRMGWVFWVALAALALVIYTAAFMLQGRSYTAPAVQNLDLHDCTLPEVKVDLTRANGDHDVVAPYAHSTCREGDVRLWESLH